MNYIRYAYRHAVGYGLLEQNTVIPLEGSYFETFKRTHERLCLNQVKLLAPCIPQKALCIGINYRDHAAEVGHSVPKSPVVFMKPISALVGPNDPIVHPANVKRVDYEAELVIVIKKTAKHVSEKDAADYILGYTCGNDVTARDYQSPTGQWTIPKGFDTFMPIGPVIVDDVDPTALHIESRLNGVVKQSSNTSNLVFNTHYLVSYLSSIMTLYPQDIIMTGTPGGISPMAVGDTIEIEIEGIGILTNPIVAERI